MNRLKGNEQKCWIGHYERKKDITVTAVTYVTRICDLN